MNILITVIDVGWDLALLLGVLFHLGFGDRMRYYGED